METIKKWERYLGFMAISACVFSLFWIGTYGCSAIAGYWCEFEYLTLTMYGNLVYHTLLELGRSVRPDQIALSYPISGPGVTTAWIVLQILGYFVAWKFRAPTGHWLAGFPRRIHAGI